MSTKNSNTSQELFNLNGKPSFGQALPLAFQHVVAMIIGCVAPAIILAGVSGLSESDTVVSTPSRYCPDSGISCNVSDFDIHPAFSVYQI